MKVLKLFLQQIDSHYKTLCSISLDNIVKCKKWVKHQPENWEYLIFKSYDSLFCGTKKKKKNKAIDDDLNDYLPVISKMKISSLNISLLWKEISQNLVNDILSWSIVRENLWILILDWVYLSICAKILKTCLDFKKMNKIELKYSEEDIEYDSVRQIIWEYIFKTDFIPEILKTNSYY